MDCQGWLAGTAPAATPARRARAASKSPGAVGAAPEAAGVAPDEAGAPGTAGGVAVVEVITVYLFPSSEGGQGRPFF